MRLRWVVDNPRGPKGGNNDVTTIFRSIASARRNVKRGEEGALGRVLELDLDDLAATDLSAEARHQYAERMMIKWSERCLETHVANLPSGPLFDGKERRNDHLTALPELTREDMRELGEAFAVWLAWRGTRRAKPYMEEANLGDAIVSILGKLGEVAG